MALTKKQIKQLRAMANSLKPLFYVGKNDLTESAVKQADETIEKHELIKCAVQDGSGSQPRRPPRNLPNNWAPKWCSPSATASCSSAAPTAMMWSISSSYASEASHHLSIGALLWRYHSRAPILLLCRDAHY